jgi:phosphocarrier protein
MVLEREFVVSNKYGVHARVAAQIVEAAKQFSSQIWIVKGDNRVDGKSILDVMTLAATRGSKLRVTADGNDASEAIEALERLFARNFYEESD